ncbi:oxidoreductase aldo/keto reductase 2 family [Vibrio maritimus]|uniref:Oxidoreductase aldo/keto reductase 2 family n=1 Tax=Vibrio maritimus TaxID=990268 RepID=A0A090RRR9_9VIBR|nr:oxidoreductase aldo/keto reductase 2 family [Vibrio maritimus]
MVSKVTMAPSGPDFSELVQGYWRLADWGMTPQERLTFLKQHIELGVTTVDHADIYGNYECEILFGEALALDPAVRKEIQIYRSATSNFVVTSFRIVRSTTTIRVQNTFTNR